MNNGLIALLSSLALTSIAHAESSKTSTTVLETLVSAEPIDRKAPKYPRLAASKGQEGWVRLSFVIDKQGNVVDPIVHDSSGIERFEKAALSAVKDWKYSPAMVDGKPVEQCNSKVQMDFKLHQSSEGVTRSFRRQYQALRDAIVAGDATLAETLYHEFKNEAQHNFAETVHASVVSAMYFEAKKDHEALQRELQAIANNGHRYLRDEDYISMVSKLLIMHIEKNRISEVFELADKINEIVKPETTGLSAINDLVAKVKDYVAQQDSFVVQGRIEGTKAWHHQLLLNNFDLISSGEAFERIEIRCKNKRSTYSNFEKQGFTIPEAWGQCHIYVDAPQGTEFSLVEYAS